MITWKILRRVRIKWEFWEAQLPLQRKLKQGLNDKKYMKTNVSTFEMKAKNLSHTHLKHQKIFIHPEISINDVEGKISYNNEMCWWYKIVRQFQYAKDQDKMTFRTEWIHFNNTTCKETDSNTFCRGRTSLFGTSMGRKCLLC